MLAGTSHLLMNESSVNGRFTGGYFFIGFTLEVETCRSPLSTGKSCFRRFQEVSQDIQVEYLYRGMRIFRYGMLLKINGSPGKLLIVCPDAD